MNIKTKVMASGFVESFKEYAFNLQSGHNSFYFYNKAVKKHNYILEHKGSYIHIIIDPFNNAIEKQTINNVSDFVWKFRKFINKYIMNQPNSFHSPHVYNSFENGIF